jgi:hypothetical protein
VQGKTTLVFIICLALFLGERVMARILALIGVSTKATCALLAAVMTVSITACDSKKEAAAPVAVSNSAPASTASAASTAPAAASTAFDTVASLENANNPKKLFADPSVSKFPSKDFVYGNGQTLSVEYDGSKSNPGDSVFFDLMMINPDGVVVQVGSNVFDGKVPDRVFTKSNKVFNSDVDGRSGFVEIKVVQNVGLDENGKISGKNVMLARFPIKFEASK